MAKEKATLSPEPWERQVGETAKAYEAFCAYRDLGPSRSIPKAGEIVGKGRGTLEPWSSKYKWTERAAAWDSEQDRIARQEQIKDIAATRKKQRKNAQQMQEKGMELLEAIGRGEPALRDIVQLLKLGMEQERICMGDVKEVIEERNGGEAVSPVQIYIPSNSRERENESFDDLEV